MAAFHYISHMLAMRTWLPDLNYRDPTWGRTLHHHIHTETTLPTNYSQPVTGYGQYIRQESFWETWDSTNDQLWLEDSLIPWQTFLRLYGSTRHFHATFLLSSSANNQNSNMTWCLSQPSLAHSLFFSYKHFPKWKLHLILSCSQLCGGPPLIYPHSKSPL